MDSGRLLRRTYHSHHYRHSPFLHPGKLRPWHHQVLNEIGALPLTVSIPRGVGYWASSWKWASRKIRSSKIPTLSSSTSSQRRQTQWQSRVPMEFLMIRSMIAVLKCHLRLRHLHRLEEYYQSVLKILAVRPPRREALLPLYLQPEGHGLKHNKYRPPLVAESHLQHRQNERHHLLGRSSGHHPPWLMLGNTHKLRHHHFLEGRGQARMSAIQGLLRHPGRQRLLWMKASKLRQSSKCRRHSEASDISRRHLLLLLADLLSHPHHVYREKPLMGMLYLQVVRHRPHFPLRPRVLHRHLSAPRHHLLCLANGIPLQSIPFHHHRLKFDLCLVLQLCLRDRLRRLHLHPCHRPHGSCRHLLCLRAVGHRLHPYHPCAAQQLHPLHRLSHPVEILRLLRLCPSPLVRGMTS